MIPDPTPGEELYCLHAKGEVFRGYSPCDWDDLDADEQARWDKLAREANVRRKLLHHDARELLKQRIAERDSERSNVA